MTTHTWAEDHPRFDEKRDTGDVAGDVETYANEMNTVVDELEAAAAREDYRAIDAKYVELRSLMEELDDAHDDLPAVPEVA